MSTGTAGLFDRPVVCPVLVGRASVLDALHRLIDGVEGDRCRMALMTGDAGIGKSRLVAETRAYATARGFVVLEGACFPQDRACPYAPMLDVLRACFAGQSPEAMVSAMGPFTRELYSLLPDLAPRPTEPSASSQQPPPPPLETEQERRRLFDALAHCLIGQGAERPVLVVVEDLHWCDDGSLDFLLYLARRAAAAGARGMAPLLLLGTYRVEDADPRLRHWLAQLDREHLAQELALAPLTREEIAAMIVAMVGRRGPPATELRDTIYGLAEGNPFYTEELLKALMAAGYLSDGDDAGRGNGGATPEWRIPRGVQDAVQQRIARLGSPAREVLSLAAVVGRRFDFGLLRRLAHVDEATLLGLIKELIAAQLVVEESPEQFAFRHALTREATYSELLARERMALHRTVAQVAEEIYAESSERRLDDLAYHYHQAGVWEKAVDYAQRAGERALRLYAPRAAVEQLTRALDAAEHLTTSTRSAPPLVSASRLASIHRERGLAYETLGDFRHARADYEAAIEIAQTASDQRAEWEALLDLGVLWTGRDYGQAGAYFQRALDLARALGEPTLLAHSLNRVGNWRVNTAQPREALPLHREALSIFEELDERRGIAATLDFLGMASYLGADLAGSIHNYERAVALFRELDDRPGLVSSLAMLANRGGSSEHGSRTSDAAELAAGVRDGERAAQLARAIDWRAGEAFALFILATVLGPLGAYARALELAGRGLRIAEEIEHLQWTAGAHCALGEIYLDLLALPAARRHLERGLELAQ